MAQADEQQLRTYLRRATAELKRTSAELEAERAKRHEPIVISGMSVRLPGGVSSPDELWDLLVSEGDGIGGFPTDRGWDVEALFDPEPGVPGRTYVREGGFLEGAGLFDAEFFGISPREAASMDPQQRLLLESAWEALEHAGFNPRALRGTSTGVFVGAWEGGYTNLVAATEGEVLNGVVSFTAGRISYTLGLEGPAVTVDTACSSSLVALHQAVQAVRLGECDRALAGGVTVMSSPRTFVEFSRQQGLSAAGRCRSFSDDADGFAPSEGVALVVVERLSDAVAAGRHVWGVVAGSAINQDGASNGLTAPSGPAQERVIVAALGAAGVSAGEVDVVEAHGTGTRLGDPIEAHAVLATYGRDRAGEPLLLGSLKSNVGHTQAAAGVAGVVKVLLGMDRGFVPASLHVGTPSTHVDWDAGAVEVVAQGRDWPARADGGPRRAAVSAFGVSGTNAHVVIEAPSAQEPGASEDGPVGGVLGASAQAWPVPWSARTPAGVAAGGARLASWSSARGSVSVAGVGASLAARAVFGSRAVVVADGSEALAAGARSTADGMPGVGVVTTPSSGPVAAGAGVVLVFAGQGGQWVGMGARLLEESTVFADSIAACGEVLAPLVEWDLADVIRSGDGLDKVEVVQPVAWAVMVSLARMWAAAGVQVDGVVGHSQGELAAAVLSGGLSLEAAAAVVVARSRVIAEGLSGAGVMASVTEPVERVREALADVDGVEVAVVNGPSQVVVSGQVDAVTAWVEQKAADGWRAKVIGVDYASHSSVVDQVADELTESLTAALAGVPGGTGDGGLGVPMWSSVGAVHESAGTALATVTAEQLSEPAYWVQNLRSAVEFGAVVDALIGEGRRAFVEVGAHPVLSQAIEQVAEDRGVQVVTAASMRRDDGGIDRWWTELGRVWVAGVDVDWTRLLPVTDRLDVPTYPFQHQHFWPEVPDAPAITSAARRWDGWCHTVAWEQVTLPPTDGEGRHVLLTSDDPESGQRAESLRARLADAGLDAQVQVVPPAAVLRDADAVVAALLEGTDAPAVVATVWSDDPSSDGPSAARALARLVQAVHAADVGTRLWCVTRDAVAVGDEPLEESAAALWGLGRGVGLEQPQLWGGLVDVPSAPTDDDWSLVTRALVSGAEDQLAVRAGTLHGRRLQRSPAPRPSQPWTPTGTVLVTGGTGGLGAHLARRLADRGAERIVLVSRSGSSAEGVADLVTDLQGRGADVEVAAVDVSDRGAVAALLETERPRAIVHAAGVEHSGSLLDVDAATWDGVYAGKVAGARHLADVAQELGLELDAFVLYSSGAGVWGSAGQSVYGAANAALDAQAARLRAAGLPATSVAWGLWGGGGMGEGAGQDHLEARGLGVMDPSSALDALEAAVGAGLAHLVVADVDWERFAEVFESVRPSRLLDGVVRRDEPVDTAASAPAPGLDLAGLSTQQRLDRVTERVRSHAAAVLGHGSASDVSDDVSFNDLGFSSVTAVELSKRLGDDLGVRLPSTVVFDHPSALDLATYVCEELVPEQEPDPREEVRALLAAIPLDVLASSEALAQLRELARQAEGPDEDVEGVDLDALDEDDLVARALSLAGPTEEGEQGER